MESAAKEEGPGNKYLVQHSAGSGKSNTIAWLAHRLMSLHGTDDKPIFDKVVVITDRKVLGVVKEFEKEGVPKAAIERIFAPMGLEIGAVTPEEIAVSVAAEMIACRRLPAGDWKSLSKSIYAGKKLTTA